MPALYQHPRHGWALVSRVIYLVSFASTIGALVGFLTLVFVGIVGVESFGVSWRDGGWDPVWRVGVGVAGISVLVAAGVAVPFYCLSQLAFVRQLARTAQSPLLRTRVPGAREHKLMRIRKPFIVLYIYAFLYLGIGSFFLVGLAVVLPQSFARDPGSVAELLPLLFLLIGLMVLVILLLVVEKRVWSKQWQAAQKITDVVWSWTNVDAATRRIHVPPFAFQPRSRPLYKPFLTGSGVVLGLGLAIFATTLFIRQPGRFAEPREYDAAGEAAIDLLILVSSIIISLGLLVMVATALIGFVEILRERRRLLSLAESGAAPQPLPGRKNLAADESAKAYDEVMAAPAISQLIGVTVAGLAWGNVLFFAVTQYALPNTWPAWLIPALLVTGALATAVVLWSDGAGARYKNRLRAAWG